LRLRLSDRQQPGVIDSDRRDEQREEDQHEADPGCGTLAKAGGLQPAGLPLEFRDHIAGLLRQFEVKCRVEFRRRFGDLDVAWTDVDLVARPDGRGLHRPPVQQDGGRA
jgi:hypothetical protein